MAFLVIYFLMPSFELDVLAYDPFIGNMCVVDGGGSIKCIDLYDGMEISDMPLLGSAYKDLDLRILNICGITNSNKIKCDFNLNYSNKENRDDNYKNISITRNGVMLLSSTGYLVEIDKYRGLFIYKKSNYIKIHSGHYFKCALSDDNVINCWHEDTESVDMKADSFVSSNQIVDMCGENLRQERRSATTGQAPGC